MNKSESRILIFRDEHHFASAHFLLEMGKCERLHGHNYTMTFEMKGEVGKNRTIIDFNDVNPILRELCDSLDHMTLIAENDPRQTLSISDTEVEVTFGKKRYVIPRGDCVTLPLDATTVERLSEYLCCEVIEKLDGKLDGIEWIEVGVREGAAQMAITRQNI